MARAANLKNTTISLPRGVYLAARRAAAEQDKSLSRYVAGLVERELETPSGLSPGELLVLDDDVSRNQLDNTEPLITDKEWLMSRK